MHDHRYPGRIEGLRNSERVARLEPERVVDLCLEDVLVETVLDVGTGSGLFAEIFAKRGMTVTGVDVREEMVAADAGLRVYRTLRLTHTILVLLEVRTL